MNERIDTQDQYEEFDQMGEAHDGSSELTPIRSDSFELSDDEKITQIHYHFANIMDILGLDLTDDSLKGTPRRVAKMYVKEVFNGLNPANRPEARTFNNNYDYSDVVIEKNIQVNSFCEHHILPIIGKAHVAYISTGKVIGLSKINRLVDYYSRRPQVQERLTLQIADAISNAMNTEDVAVNIESKHLCVSMRGIKDHTRSTITSEFRGAFKKKDTQLKFVDFIRTPSE